jgi:DNA-binding FadR family transcriptional regulator
MMRSHLAVNATGKLAERVAESLVSEIAHHNFSDGHALGSEAELAARLEVSRWTVREALTILERQGQVDVRPGRYGGIFVAVSTPTAISDSIARYLEFTKVSVREIIDARQLLEDAILGLASQRLTADDIPALRASQGNDPPSGVSAAGFTQYDALLKTARSPVLHTFTSAVACFGLSAVLRSDLDDQDFSHVMREVRTRRREQIEAVIAGQLRIALQAEDEILGQIARLLSSSQMPGARLPTRRHALQRLAATRRFKRPELLAQQIGSDIVALGWPVGQHLGSEADLLSRYGVSRSTFREAVRSLEQMGVVQMKVGRHSGLKICSPNPASVVRTSCESFRRLGVTRADLHAALVAIGVGAVGLAAARSPDARDLRGKLAAPGAQLLNVLGHASGNRILALFLQILNAHLDKDSCQVDGRQQSSLCEAIDAGDAPAARRQFLSLVEVYATSQAGSSQEVRVSRQHRPA